MRSRPHVAGIRSTGGGSQSVLIMRFFGDKISVRVGDTVEWTNKATPVAHGYVRESLSTTCLRQPQSL